MVKIAVIEKATFCSRVWLNLIRKNTVLGLSAEQVVAKYQGFEGRMISFSSEDPMEVLGFDVGVCDEERTVFSSIFNEILFGNVDELANWKQFLNEYFLFSEESKALEYISLHKKLSALGKDVEDYEEFAIYQIIRQLPAN